MKHTTLNNLSDLLCERSLSLLVNKSVLCPDDFASKLRSKLDFYILLNSVVQCLELNIQISGELRVSSLKSLIIFLSDSFDNL